jgi:hypothetical protein
MADDDDMIERFYSELRRLANTTDKQFLLADAAALARRFKAVASVGDVEKAKRQLAHEVAGPQPIVGTLSGL